MDELKPKTHQEAVAVFRHGLIGALTQSQMDRGQLSEALEELAKQRFLAPRAKTTRHYSAATLERWFYAFKKRGLAGLLPRPRKDKGRAKALTPELRKLLCDIRREHPRASSKLIVRTLVADGRMDQKGASVTTVRRLFRDAGLDHAGASPVTSSDAEWVSRVSSRAPSDSPSTTNAHARPFGRNFRRTERQPPIGRLASIGDVP